MRMKYLLHAKYCVILMKEINVCTLVIHIETNFVNQVLNLWITD